MKCFRVVMIFLLASLLGMQIWVQEATSQGDDAEKDFARGGLYLALGFDYSIQQFPEDEISGISGVNVDSCVRTPYL